MDFLQDVIKSTAKPQKIWSVLDVLKEKLQMDTKNNDTEKLQYEINGYKVTLVFSHQSNPAVMDNIYNILKAAFSKSLAEW